MSHHDDDGFVRLSVTDRLVNPAAAGPAGPGPGL